ncbi:MAG TPA: type II secretion system protein GspM [Rudaea sp.]|nr:type II secretion system protein GspM [Rudaea sp.]
MRLLPEARNSRFLALVLLAIVLLVVYVAGVHWWFVAPELDMADQMSDLREQQQRFRQTVAQKPEIEKRLAEVRAFEQGNQAFLTDADSNSAFSDLTQRLKQAISARVKDENRCQIVSNSNFKGGEEELYQRVTIQVRMRCDLEPFAGILYEIENGNPYLFVDQLMIYRQQGGYIPPGGKAPQIALDIRFNLSGYLRKPGKSA